MNEIVNYILEINSIDNPGFEVKFKIIKGFNYKEFKKISYINKYNNWEKFHWDYETNMEYSYFFDDWYSIELINDEIISYGDPLKLNFIIMKIEELTNSKLITVDESEIINWLSNWYKIECNGDWEHSFGFTIHIKSDIVFVEIDLEDTRFDNELTMGEINYINSGNNWMKLKIENQKFKGEGDRSKLIKILKKFIELHEFTQFPYRSE